MKAPGDKTVRAPDHLDAQGREMERLLSAIREELRKPVSSAFSAGGLTGPQRLVMQVLVRAGRPLFLKELQREVGLAQSTVSAIVRRLVEKQLIRRTASQSDRRGVQLEPSAKVLAFLKNAVPGLAATPLTRALQRASPLQRRQILKALRELDALLKADP